MIEFVAWLGPREIHPTVQQPYRQLKKYLLPHVPGTVLGDFASYRSAEGVPQRCDKPLAITKTTADHASDLPGVPSKLSIDEYQVFYHRTYNLGYGMGIMVLFFFKH